jgi:hypothetical protein
MGLLKECRSTAGAGRNKVEGTPVGTLWFKREIVEQSKAPGLLKFFQSSSRNRFM